jgi:hypothetical protein
MLPPVVTLYHVNVFDDVLIVDVSAREEICVSDVTETCTLHRNSPLVSQCPVFRWHPVTSARSEIVAAIRQVIE